jgi:hypothetical protein
MIINPIVVCYEAKLGTYLSGIMVVCVQMRQWVVDFEFGQALAAVVGAPFYTP